MIGFAVALPWWGYVLAFAAALLCAWAAYARVAVRLTPRDRALLTALRALTLLLLVAFLLRPVQYVQAEGAGDGVVAVLVDTSRSMRLEDADGPRIARARSIVEDLQAQLSSRFQTEVLSFGESVARADVEHLGADARRSDLSGALAAVRDRYRGRPLAGIVVVSDGGDTSVEEAGRNQRELPPVYTIGLGSPVLPRDREVVNLTAGEARLADASVDLSVVVTSSGFGTEPIELRVSENGRPIDTRRVTPAADAAPIHEVFTVAPSPDRPTVYTVEVPVDGREMVAENNTRSVLVPARGRRRTVLVVEGAPGFEHTFLKRALARDSSLEVDSVVRKGKNDEGRDTFFIQAASSRANALASGYPTRRADLFRYDAVIFGNVAGDFFSRDQLAMTAEFVATRGGGLLVLGARSFESAGLANTPLEEVLPIDLRDRARGELRAVSGQTPAANTLALTADGVAHAATRLVAAPADNQRRWEELPALASVVAAGAPRPGAQVLAVSASGGQVRPLIVAQRYGMGRSLVFAGEASWRWRMLLPASNDTHELVWRQLARWVSSSAADPIEIPPTSVTLPGTTETVSVLVRDDEFKPIANAVVNVRVTEPGGRERSLTAALADPSTGRYSTAVAFDERGVYTIAAHVQREGTTLGSALRPVLVGGFDAELAEPRLNEPVLRRIAEASGGRYVPADEAASVPPLLQRSEVGRPPQEMRDLWHNGFSLVLLIALLAGEWLLRRRVGLA